MRVTNKMIANSFITHINRNASRLQTHTEQLSSGKIIQRPSDDPARTAKSLMLQQSVNETDQYIKNLDTAESLFEATDTAFAEINNILQRVRELAVTGANGTLNQVAKDSISGELVQLKEQLLEVANTNHQGKYVFATNSITEKPFQPDFTRNPSEPEALNSRNIEIAPNIVLDLNNSGKSLFIRTTDATTTPPTEFSIFSEIEKLAEHVRNGATSDVSAMIGDFDNYIDGFIQERVNVGAKTLRVENTIDRYRDEKINLTELLSKTEDVDIAETMVQYKMQESVYEASLMSGNRLMSISLLDFMR